MSDTAHYSLNALNVHTARRITHSVFIKHLKFKNKMYFIIMYLDRASFYCPTLACLLFRASKCVLVWIFMPFLHRYLRQLQFTGCSLKG